MCFEVLRLVPGEELLLRPGREQALVLLDGSVRLAWAGAAEEAARTSLFDAEPTTLHLPASEGALVRAPAGAELALVSTDNPRPFAPALLRAGELLESEERGRGRQEDAAWRTVRTIFDLRNRPQSGLVLGEVVHRAGRWSSWPPHHHPQPEVYHYRFDHPAGYGHGECGESVHRVRHGDTLLIAGGQDHAQVAGPGYRMWYLWVIRHIEGFPYRSPEFAPEHRWQLD
jgi:5-deoxy-glucuronate isomerase